VQGRTPASEQRAPKSAGGSDGAASEAGSGQLPDPFTTCDLTQLDKDFLNTQNIVREALDAALAMQATAGQFAVELNEPERAAASIRQSGLTVPEPDRRRLKDELDKVEQAVLDVNQRFHAVEKAREDLDAALIELNNLPDQAPPKDDDDPSFSVGKRVEHAWDMINAVTSVLKQGVTVRDVAQAILGSDAVKDRVEKLADRLANAEADIDHAMIVLNAAINVQKFVAAKRVQDGASQLARAVDDYKAQLGLFARHRDEFIQCLTETVAKVQAAAPAASATIPSARSVAQVYGAVIVAGSAVKAAKSALITDTLSEQQYKVWMQQLVPPGTLLLELPDGGEPTAPRVMTVAGDVIFYRKGNTNFAYRATRQKIEAYATQFAPTDDFYDRSTSVINTLDAWTKAMTGVLD
jgi:hypothetical protein